MGSCNCQIAKPEEGQSNFDTGVKPESTICKVDRASRASHLSIHIATNESENFIVRKAFPYKDSEYTGQMMLDENGKLVPHGFGTQIWSDKTMYQGSYDMGQKQGNGKLTWPDHKFYVGQFNEDKIEGVGTLMNAEKKILYRGGWKDNKFEGQGREVFNGEDTSQSSYFLGNYESGWKHGAGTLRNADGTYQKGNWEKDKLQGVVFGKLKAKNDKPSKSKREHTKGTFDLSFE